MKAFFFSIWRFFFHLPSPVELGWSPYNALGMRLFESSDDPNQKTWEDWDEYMQEHYPVKYFVVKRIPDFFRPFKGKVSRLWYRAQVKFYPSKYDYYKINLAKVNPKEFEPGGGYLDPAEALLLCVWYCLLSYVEECEPSDPATFMEPDDPCYSHQKQIYDEVMFLYDWWKRVRPQNLDNMLKALDKTVPRKERYDAYNKLRDAFEAEEEVMLLRVCKLRPYLWV